ncbi:hydrocephalus-inducing protein-like [Arapaima gigas]
MFCEINIDLLDQADVFTLIDPSGTVCSPVNSESDAERKVTHETPLLLNVGQQVEIYVEFRPTAQQSFEAQVRLLVVDNQYEETMVQLVGEGYRDIITLDNIGSKAQAEEHGATVEGFRCDILHFGDCHVGRPYQDTFTMTNHSSSEVLRFEWPPDGPQLRFFPRVGHLHAGCSKDVTVTFCSEQPIALSAQMVKCKLCRVVFQQPIDQRYRLLRAEGHRHVLGAACMQVADPGKEAELRTIRGPFEPEHLRVAMVGHGESVLVGPAHVAVAKV